MTGGLVRVRKSTVPIACAKLVRPFLFPPHRATNSRRHPRQSSERYNRAEDVLQLRPCDVVGVFLGCSGLVRRLRISQVRLYEERELPMHEFLRVDFYDRQTGLCNCILVERAAPVEAVVDADNGVFKTMTCIFSGGKAVDSFLVPCRHDYTHRPRELSDGHYRLLYAFRSCHEQQIPLAKLAVACSIMSQRQPLYKSITAQCFWYARSIFGIVTLATGCPACVPATPDAVCSRKNALYRGVKALAQARADHHRKSDYGDFKEAWRTFKRRLLDACCESSSARQHSIAESLHRPGPVSVI